MRQDVRDLGDELDGRGRLNPRQLELDFVMVFDGPCRDSAHGDLTRCCLSSSNGPSASFGSFSAQCLANATGTWRELFLLVGIT